MELDIVLLGIEFVIFVFIIIAMLVGYFDSHKKLESFLWTLGIALILLTCSITIICDIINILQ